MEIPYKLYFWVEIAYSVGGGGAECLAVVSGADVLLPFAVFPI